MFKRLLPGATRLLLLVVLALWLGGLICLFISVSALFVHDRSTANVAAPVLFHVFDIYQRFLAGGSLALAVLLLWLRPGFGAWASFACTAVASLLAATIALYVMPELESLLRENIADKARFDAMHNLSEQVYTAAALLVFAAFLSVALARPTAGK